MKYKEGKGQIESMTKTSRFIELHFSWDPKDPAVQEILAAGIFLPLPGFDR